MTKKNKSLKSILSVIIAHPLFVLVVSCAFFLTLMGLVIFATSEAAFILEHIGQELNNDRKQ